MTTAQQDVIPSPLPFTWLELYHMLTRYMRHYVYNVRSWRGQEQDMLEDIVQQSITRVFEYLQAVEQGQAPPIISPYRFCHVIAYHLFQDQCRKSRLVSRLENNEEGGIQANLLQTPEESDSLTMMLKTLIQASLLDEAIDMFLWLPEKAQLVNLAHLFKDNEEAFVLLETALARIHISLRDYLARYSSDPRSKNSYASSLSIARKKLRAMAKEYYGQLNVIFV